MSDERELADRLAQESPFLNRNSPRDGTARGYPVEATAPPTPILSGGNVQWSSNDSVIYRPMGRTTSLLPPGMYDIDSLPGIGLVFRRLGVKTEELLVLPDSPAGSIADEIARFWDRRTIFDDFGMPHKRGILLWGDAGGGKSCIIRLVMADVIKRGGVGFRYHDPGLFEMGFNAFREIQPETPVVALMEDLDALVENSGESTLLNTLDGALNVQHVVFLASTNYPERLGPRIVNRPSRFDRRYKIRRPTLAAREVYLRHLLQKTDEDYVKWAIETDGLGLAHLAELFKSVVILGNKYEETLEILKGMSQSIKSNETRTMGLLPGAAA